VLLRPLKFQRLVFACTAVTSCNKVDLFLLYDGESVNRSQMDIRRKTCDIRSWRKYLFLDITSTNIDTFFHRFNSASKSTAQKSSDCCLSHSFTSVSTSSSLRKYINQVLNRFTRQTLPTVNRKHFFIHILCIEPLCPEKRTHKRTLLFGSTPLSKVAILTIETGL
jgi:hypothetical protein